MPQKNLHKGFDRFAKKLSTTPTQSCIQKEACPGSGSTEASFFNLEKPKSMQKNQFFPGWPLAKDIARESGFAKILGCILQSLFIPGKGSTCSQTNIPVFVVAGTNALSNPSTWYYFLS